MRLNLHAWTAAGLIGFISLAGCHALQSRLGLSRDSHFAPRTIAPAQPYQMPSRSRDPVVLPEPAPSEPLRLPAEVPPAADDEEESIPSAGLAPIRPVCFQQMSSSCSPCVTTCSPCGPSCYSGCGPGLGDHFQGAMARLQGHFSETKARIGCMGLKMKSSLSRFRSCGSCSPCVSSCDPCPVSCSPCGDSGFAMHGMVSEYGHPGVYSSGPYPVPAGQWHPVSTPVQPYAPHPYAAAPGWGHAVHPAAPPMHGQAPCPCQQQQSVWRPAPQSHAYPVQPPAMQPGYATGYPAPAYQAPANPTPVHPAPSAVPAGR